MGGHLVRVPRYHDMIRSQRLRIVALRRRRGERDYFCAEGMGELDPHVSEAADAHDTDLLARSDLPVLQRRPGSDACTQQRCRGSELVLAM